MRIEALEVQDDVALRAAYDVRAAALDHDHPLDPADPFPEFVVSVRHGTDAYANEWWVVWSGDGHVVGLLRLRLPQHDNIGQVQVELHVHPAHRRQGAGTALFEHLLARTRALGRTHVLAEVAEPLGGGGSPGTAFARSRGARLVLVEVFRSLDVSGLRDEEHAPLRKEAESASTGYEVVSWRDQAPEEFVHDLAELAGRMSTDAPLGEMTYEPETWDRARS